jgi:four helix bundle protein
MDTHTASEVQRSWERACPEAITSDVIWKLDAYRASLFLLHLARLDCAALRAANADASITHQLIEAAGSISANISEGYSRGTRTDRLRFYGYALGSVRECVSWYQAVRDALPGEAIDARLELIMRIRALLLGLIRAQRENRPGYGRFEA